MMNHDEVMVVLIKESVHNSQIMFVLSVLKKIPYGDMVISDNYENIIEMYVDDMSNDVKVVEVNKDKYCKLLTSYCGFMKAGIIDYKLGGGTVLGVHPHRSLVTFNEVIPDSILNDIMSFDLLALNPPVELVKWLYTKLPEELAYTKSNREIYDVDY